MRIKENTDINLWEDFIAKNRSFDFLQSRLWGQILAGEKRDLRFWEVWSGKKLLAVTLIEKKKIARGGLFYLESLWGPVFAERLGKVTPSSLLRCIYQEIIKGESIFWRLSPPANVLISPHRLESDFYFETGKVDESGFAWEFSPTFARTRPPQKTLFLDLSQSEQEILAQMKPKTRYNVNLAGKKKLKIVWSNKKEDLKKFWQLNLATAKRGGFNPHHYKHYQEILKAKTANSRNRAELILASHKGKILSANLALFFNDTVYYLHGASGNEGRNLMSPYLLHWETILRAKKEGFPFYDFWGVDAEKWPGVTRFKEGFGGTHKNYPPIYEIPLKSYYYKLYRMYSWIKK